LLCHGTVCVVGKIRDLILQLSKSSIYSTKPFAVVPCAGMACRCKYHQAAQQLQNINSQQGLPSRWKYPTLSALFIHTAIH
jgi:hypothetical protein